MNTKKTMVLKVLVLSIATTMFSPDCSAVPDRLKRLTAWLGLSTTAAAPAIIFPDQVANTAAATSDKIGQFILPSISNSSGEIEQLNNQIKWAQSNEYDAKKYKKAIDKNLINGISKATNSKPELLHFEPVSNKVGQVQQCLVNYRSDIDQTKSFIDSQCSAKRNWWTLGLTKKPQVCAMHDSIALNGPQNEAEFKYFEDIAKSKQYASNKLLKCLPESDYVSKEAVQKQNTKLNSEVNRVQLARINYQLKQLGSAAWANPYSKYAMILTGAMLAGYLGYKLLYRPTRGIYNGLRNANPRHNAQRLYDLLPTLRRRRNRINELQAILDH